MGGVYIGSTAPSNPLPGRWFFDTDDDKLYMYDGSAWKVITGSGGGGSSLTVIGGDGITVTTTAGKATVAVDLATAANGLVISSGELKAEIATKSSLGTVKVGSGIDVDSAGEISVDLSGVDVNADLDYTAATDRGTVTNTAGDDAVIPLADATNAGLFTAAEKTKLAGLNNTGQNDGRYLRIDSGTFDQTVESTGDVTFSGLTEHEDGVYVAGGSTDSSVAAGQITYDSGDKSLLLNTDESVDFKLDHKGLTIGGNATRTGGPQYSYTANVNYSSDASQIFAFIDQSNYTNRGDKQAASFRSVPSNLTFKAGDSQPFAAFRSDVDEDKTSGNNTAYCFFGVGTAPNYLKGSTYIGGSRSRNTFELWKSTLTEEQLEQFEAGTLAVPANVTNPGDGEFARQWWYDQQDAETQAAIDAGELDYPKNLAAATFADTFALGDNTNINLNSDGSAFFQGSVTHNFDTIYSRSGAVNDNYARAYLNANSSDDYGLQFKHYLGDTTKTNAAVHLGGSGSSTKGHITLYTSDDDNTNAVARVVVDPDGKVGVGTTSPNNTLSVVSGTSGQGDIDTNNQLQISRSGTASYAAYLSYGRLVGSNNYGFSISALNNNIDADILIAPKGGKVGVGVDNPNQDFVVAAGTNRQFYVSEGSASNYVRIGSSTLNSTTPGYLEIDGYAIHFNTETVDNAVRFNRLGDVTFAESTEHKEGIQVTGGTHSVSNNALEITYDTSEKRTEIKGASTGYTLVMYAGGMNMEGSNNRPGFACGGLFSNVKYTSDVTEACCFSDVTDVSEISGKAKFSSFVARCANVTFEAGDTTKFLGFESRLNKDNDSGNNLSYGFFSKGNAPNYFAGETHFFSTDQGHSDYLGIIKSSNGRGSLWARTGKVLLGTDADQDLVTSGGANAIKLEYFKSQFSGNHNDLTSPIAQFIRSGGTSTQPARAIEFYRGASYGGAIMVSNSDISVAGISDYRLKSDVIDLPSAVDLIKQLKPRQYTMRGVKNQVGFVAHELQEVVPAAVFGEKDGTEPTGTLTDWDGTELETDVTEPPVEELTYEEQVEVTPEVDFAEATFDEEGNELTPEVPAAEATYETVTHTRKWTATGTQPVMQSVDQTKLIPLLTKALQEALERIEVLEAAAAGGTTKTRKAS